MDDLFKSAQTLAADPTVRALGLMWAGYLTKWARDVLGLWIQHKGTTDVQRAEIAMKVALKTEDAQDDAVAEMALARAKSNQVFMEKLVATLAEGSPPPPVVKQKEG